MPGLLGDFRLLVILFIAFRVMLLLAFQPLALEGGERGLTTGGDYLTYFNIASLADSVGAPFQAWWSEFPPGWTFLSVLVYQLTGGSYASYALILGVIMLTFDTGNLVLLRKIGTHLYGANTGMALAWIYAGLLAPLVFTFWTFEPLVAFWLLLGLWWLLKKQETRSAIAAAVGALTKFTPVLLLGAVWRFREKRAAVRYTVVLIGLFVLVYLPLFATNAAMTLPSLTAQFNKASYQTVWALLDGNYRTGNFGPLTDRTDPAKVTVTQGNPAVVPGWLRLGGALVIGLLVFVRTRRFDDRGLVAFVTITLLVFFVQAQGWSPQWLAQIVPLVLLCFPTRDGVLIVMLLSAATFTEYPFLFLRTGETGGEITGVLVLPFTALVLARTVMLVGLGVALYRKLRQEPVL
ncbi:MAG TPA: hypothetical protein VHO69_11505 [Phototrophicaceae bacterium]|nr:hypothetical protein [Phototrophicaceae bacterium]